MDDLVLARDRAAVPGRRSLNTSAAIVGRELRVRVTKAAPHSAELAPCSEKHAGTEMHLSCITHQADSSPNRGIKG